MPEPVQHPLMGTDSGPACRACGRTIYTYSVREEWCKHTMADGRAELSHYVDIVARCASCRRMETWGQVTQRDGWDEVATIRHEHECRRPQP